ncbi:hypothetical protein BO71DRAFT_368311 [Aspergillus ellipticus CBS 707.79]|uniref:Uncharacterized protein n=1 Tax=Aspergillus ellipticus CBS 707.79 TaxID=1448320 RepID=A0A319DQ16_9EURO|nr:hypothetical protein BO71DRAFT_368311 [Aspergillus ellipticus CBS 707.79]
MEELGLNRPERNELLMTISFMIRGCWLRRTGMSVLVGSAFNSLLFLVVGFVF